LAGPKPSTFEIEIILDLGPDIAPRAAITDKGYDAKAIRDGACRRGICPVIPFKPSINQRSSIQGGSASSSASNA
jgi:hypothetical protein